MQISTCYNESVVCQSSSPNDDTSVISSSSTYDQCYDDPNECNHTKEDPNDWSSIRTAIFVTIVTTTTKWAVIVVIIVVQISASRLLAKTSVGSS
jgi:hypothetical protein